jgi:hypothetical protein
LSFEVVVAHNISGFVESDLARDKNYPSARYDSQLRISNRFGHGVWNEKLKISFVRHFRFSSLVARRFEKVAALIGRSGSFVLGSVKRAAFA